MGIEEIVDVQISIADTAVTRAGFGIGLIVGSSSRLSAKVEEFADLQGRRLWLQSGHLTDAQHRFNVSRARAGL